MFEHQTEEANWKVDTLWWIMTGLCNLKCKHCYIESPRQRYKQLSFDQCIEVIDQAKAAGIQKIFITGGEPFFRRDMSKIIDRIYAQGLKIVGIETNATLLNEQIIALIPDTEIIWHISYDGYQCHDHLRGVLGAEKKTIAAIQQLKKVGVKVAINTALSISNSRTLLETYKRLKALQIDSWQLFPIVSIGHAKTMQTEKLSVEQEGDCYVKLFDVWSQDEKPFSLFLSGLLTKEHKRINGEEIKHMCDYFRSSVTLMPDGMLIPCCRYIEHATMMKQMQTIFQRSMQEQIKTSKLKQIKNTTLQELLLQGRNKSCKNCDLLDACQLGCRINAYIETGNLYHKEENHCNLMRCYYKKYLCQQD